MNHELLSKAVYTASEAAQLCNLSRREIIRHVAAGRLPAQRIPGTRKRRIPRASLLEFMRANGMSTAELETARPLAPRDDLANGPSDILLRSLDNEGRLAPEEGCSNAGSILDELPTEVLIELSPKIPGAQVRINRRHG